MEIKTITSEAELNDRFFEIFRQFHVVPMMMEYLGEGAKMFYGFYGHMKPHNFETRGRRHWDFFQKHFTNSGEKIAFVSLGCGNAASEKYLLQEAKRQGYHLDYFGVDSSMAMLEMAKNILEDVDMEKQLLCADFGTRRFVEEIQDLTKDYDARIFVFFEGTIGTVEQDYLADAMADMMQAGDYLWADVVVRAGMEAKDDRFLFDRYKSYVEDETNNDLDFLPLRNMGLDKRAGRFYLQMMKEDGLGALRFNFMFEVKELAKINYKGQRATLMPGTNVLLYTIRSYAPQGLTEFLAARDFAAVGQYIGEGRGQFLFRK